MISIRTLQAADARAYFELRRLAEQEFPAYVGISAERELIAGEKRIAELLSNYEKEGSTVFGAFHDNRLAGIACVSRKLSVKYRHKLFLWGMYVGQEFRRQHTGKLLMAHIIAFARQTPGILALQLQVTTSNTPARAMYERLGFVVYGTERASLLAAGAYHDAHLMELAISPETADPSIHT